MKRLKVEKHHYKPFVPAGAKYLILGSFPAKEFTKERIEDSWYYGSGRNQFWKILGEVYGVQLNTKNEKQRLLENLDIAMSDIITSCRRGIESSADKPLLDKTYNKNTIKNILASKNIEKIYFTSKWVLGEFREYVEVIC